MPHGRAAVIVGRRAPSSRPHLLLIRRGRRLLIIWRRNTIVPKPHMQILVTSQFLASSFPGISLIQDATNDQDGMLPQLFYLGLIRIRSTAARSHRSCFGFDYRWVFSQNMGFSCMYSNVGLEGW
jgi:hypothetical protein